MGFLFLFPNYLKVLESDLAKTPLPEVFNGANRDLESKIRAVQVFVCDPEQLGQNLPDRVGKPYDPARVDLEKISMPFDSCYIELTGVSTILTRETQEGSDVTTGFEISAFHFIELSPLDIVCFWVAATDNAAFEINFSHLDLRTSGNHIAVFLKTILQEFCESVNVGGLGTERHHRNYPIKFGNHKYAVSVPRIIRIKPAKGVTSMPVYARTIEWSNAFWVRGHWRRKPGGIGKDRHGDYSVREFTWVSEHIRGDENSEVVKSIYRV